MAIVFSNKWKSSTKPEKQRKYANNAPLHIKGKLLHSHLSKDIHKKYNIRSLRVKAGDAVKILRGQFKGKTAKVERVSLKDTKVYLDKLEVVKQDGSKTKYPIHPSNLLITDLNLNDKRRLKRIAK